MAVMRRALLAFQRACGRGLSKARAPYRLLVCFLGATFPDQLSLRNVGNLGLHIDSEIFSDLIQSAM